MNTDDFSGDIAERRKRLDEIEKQQEVQVLKEETEKINQAMVPRRGFMANPGSKVVVKPGQTFVFGGVQYKVAGDRSFHRLTEKKPSRKAWRRQQVMERKAERERKRRVKGW